VIFGVLSPGIGIQIFLIMVFHVPDAVAGGANYGILVVALTALVVLLFAITGVPPSQLIASRALNTAMGGLLALAANRLWPTWERAHINEALAHLLDAYRDSFQAVRDAYLHPGTSATVRSPPGWTAFARPAAWRGRTSRQRWSAFASSRA